MISSKGKVKESVTKPLSVTPARSSSPVTLLLSVIRVCLLFHKMQLFTNTADSISFLPPWVNRPFIGPSRKWTRCRTGTISFPLFQFFFFLFYERINRQNCWLVPPPQMLVQTLKTTRSQTHSKNRLHQMIFIKRLSESIFERSLWSELTTYRWARSFPWNSRQAAWAHSLDPIWCKSPIFLVFQMKRESTVTFTEPSQ